MNRRAFVQGGRVKDRFGVLYWRQGASPALTGSLKCEEPEMQQGQIVQRQQRQMTQGQAPEPSVKHNVQLGSSTELKQWSKRIGPRSVAAAARYRKGPETTQQG